jgi:hypothetical protein
MLIEQKGLTPVLEKRYDEANAAYLDASTQLAALRSTAVQPQMRQNRPMRVAATVAIENLLLSS